MPYIPPKNPRARPGIDYPVTQHYTPTPGGVNPVEAAAIAHASYKQSHAPSDARGYAPSVKPRLSQVASSPWGQFKEGARRGWDFALDTATEEQKAAQKDSLFRSFFQHSDRYTRSALHPTTKDITQGLNGWGLTGFGGARIAADVAGHGTRHYLWNIHPEDVTYTIAGDAIDLAGGNKSARIAGAYLSNVALALGAGNLNLMNLDEAGRPRGFAATLPTDEDPRLTENTALEYVNRGLFGRTGRLLPWEQFHAERPDVDYQTYADYQEYLRDPGMFLGVVKGTLDGVDGAEARILGYRVTPAAALAAAGTVGAGVMAVKRFAGLRR